MRVGTKFFSFLIPVYNVELYLEELLLSILKQMPDNSEIILLDDGSKDNSLSICNAFAQKEPNLIRVISRENRGAVKTRRELMEAALGEWLWIIDSDDYILDNAVEILLDTIKSYECDMILFDHYWLKNNHKTLVHQLSEKNTTVYAGDKKRDLYRAFISDPKLNPLWNKVFRRTCVDWDTDYSDWWDVRRANDKLQMIPILSNAEKAVYIAKPLYCYRYVPGSLVNGFRDYTLSAFVKVGTRLDAYVQQWGLEDEVQMIRVNRKASQACLCLYQFATSQYIRADEAKYYSFFSELKDHPYYKLPLQNAAYKNVKDKFILFCVRHDLKRLSWIYIHCTKVIKSVKSKCKEKILRK